MKKKRYIPQGHEPKWQKKLINELSQYDWQYWFHPSFSHRRFFKEDDKTEHEAIQLLVNKFIHRLNQIRYGKRYKRKQVKGVSTAFILEHAPQKKWHGHMLLDGWDPLEPEVVYKTWISVGGCPEKKNVQIVQDEQDAAFRKLNGDRTKSYFIKRVPENPWDRYGIYGYTTAQADVAFYRLFRTENL